VGDTYFATATSNALTLSLQGFTITPGPGNPPGVLDIVKGKAATASFVITSVGGFNTPLNLVCNVPLQADMTCAVNPSQVTPTQTVTLTITTYATGGPSAERRDPKPLWPAGGAAFAVLLLVFLPRGKRAGLFTRGGRNLLVLLLLLVGLGGVFIGCSSISPVTPTSVDGTPLGQTTISLTAAANVNNTVVSHTAYLSVNVIPPS